PTPNETTLQALLTSADVGSPGIGTVTVFNGPPGGGTSNAVPFPVYTQGQLNPVPVLNSVLPTNVSSSGGNVLLTLSGTDFLPSLSEVIWTPAHSSNGLTMTPATISSTTITVVIPAADIGPTGTATVKVRNPAPGGGTSSAQNVTVF